MTENEAVGVPKLEPLSDGARMLDLRGARGFSIGKTVCDGGLKSYEPEVFAMLGALIETAERPVHMLDIGANIGLFSLTMSAIYGDALKVTAFEPMPTLAAFLTDAAARNQLAVTVSRFALGAEDGKASFYLSSRTDTSNSLNRRFRPHLSVIEVDVRKLDSLAPELDGGAFVVKLDTESTEPDVLQGARSFVETHRPPIVCEVLAGRTEEFLAKYFGELGYVSIHITGSPDWRGADRLAGDTTYTHRDWLFLPTPPSASLVTRFAAWYEAFTR